VAWIRVLTWQVSGRAEKTEKNFSNHSWSPWQDEPGSPKHKTCNTIHVLTTQCCFNNSVEILLLLFSPLSSCCAELMLLHSSAFYLTVLLICSTSNYRFCPTILMYTDFVYIKIVGHNLKLLPSLHTHNHWWMPLFWFVLHSEFLQYEDTLRHIQHFFTVFGSQHL
jgi:hypothetical protein